MSTLVILIQTLDIVLSLPSVDQLQDGDFNLDDLVNNLTEALDDGPYRKEILSFTGDTAALVIECLDKVSESMSDSHAPSPYHAVDYLF